MPTTVVPQNRILDYRTEQAGTRLLHIYVLEGLFHPAKANSRLMSEFLVEAVSTQPMATAAMRNVLNMCATLGSRFETLREEHKKMIFPFVAVPTKDGTIDEANAIYVGQALDLGLQVIDWCAAEVVRHADTQVNRPNPERTSMTIIVSSAPLAAPFDEDPVE